VRVVCVDAQVTTARMPYMYTQLRKHPLNSRESREELRLLWTRLLKDHLEEGATWPVSLEEDLKCVCVCVCARAIGPCSTGCVHARASHSVALCAYRRQDVLHAVRKALRRRVLFVDDCQHTNELLEQVCTWACVACMRGQ
jgi:hypothetical protein